MKVAIVTGASRGIGHATALHFGRAGWRVVNVSRTPLETQTSFEVRNIQADLGAPEGVAFATPELVQNARDAECIALVHNAARADSDTIFDLSADRFRAVLELNVVAPQQLSKVVRPHMHPGSSIVYVGSTLSEKAVPGVASYSTSKHATVGLMRATCQDLAGTGIHTACICPGFTDTEMLRHQANDDPEVYTAINRMVCAGRLLEPSEVAEIIYFAALHPALNGAVVHANLGQIER